MLHKKILTVLLLLFLVGCGGGGEPGSDPGGYVVTLNLNGGYFEDSTGLKHGGAFTPTPLGEMLANVLSDPMVNDGRVFAVWNTEADGSGEDYLDDTMVTGNVTLYAIYGTVIHTRSDLEGIVCNDANKIYSLDQEIDLSQGSNWEPLCASYANPFKGRLYGNGNAITGLETKTSVSEMDTYGGLFGVLDGARIKDVSITEAHTGGKTASGVLAGIAVNSDIDRVDATGTIVGGGYIGGIIGLAEENTVVRRSSFGKINENDHKYLIPSFSDTYAGGIAGAVQNAEIADCSSDSEITSEQAQSRMGGIVGYIDNGKVSNSLHRGTIDATEGSDAEIGGIAGRVVDSAVTSCYSETMLFGSEDSGSYSGGISGYSSYASISNSAVFGISVSGASPGRITGYSEGSTLDNVFVRSDALLNLYHATDGGNDGKSKPFREMRKSLTFFRDTLGFDFVNSWAFPDYYEFPRLYWEDVPEYTRILTVAELKKISKDLNGWYVLDKDIDLESIDEEGILTAWKPMGDLDDPFTGRLNGNGRTIKNLVLPFETSSQNGLFGTIEGAVITDLNIAVRPTNSKEIYDFPDGYVGILTGSGKQSRIEYVNTTGSTYNWGNTGGIAGQLTGGYIANSSFSGNIYSYNKTIDSGFIGGVIGNAVSTYAFYITSSGSINSDAQDSNQVAGGLIAKSAGSAVVDSYSDMSVYAAGGYESMAGGLIGSMTGSTVLHGYSKGSVHATCVNYTNVSASIKHKAGGIAAYTSGSAVISSAALGSSVIADTENPKATSVETIAARIVGSAATSSMAGVYAEPSMTVSADRTDGEHGLDIGSLSLYFFTDTLGMDFTNIWTMPSGSAYPVLMWQN